MSEIKRGPKILQYRKKDVEISFEQCRLDSREPNFTNESWEILALYEDKADADREEIDFLKVAKKEGYIGVVQFRRLARDGVTELRRSIETVFLSPEVLDRFTRWCCEFNVTPHTTVIEGDEEYTED